MKDLLDALSLAQLPVGELAMAATSRPNTDPAIERQPSMSIVRGINTKVSAMRHKAYVRAFSGMAPYYLVNEFPKSGGTWLALMLSDLFDVPFRRNQPIQFERSVTHGHFLTAAGLKNVVLVWRDPRDLLVSFYFHNYFVNELHNRALVDIMKARCSFEDYNDIRANLPAFIRFVNETPVSPSFTWPQFARVWVNRDSVLHTSYEALRADTVQELLRIGEALTGRAVSVDHAHKVVETHSFARTKAAAEQANRGKPEMSFIREGALGGWRKHFTPESERLLETCGYQNAMNQLGY